MCLLRLELCLELLNLVDIALIDLHELSVWLVIDELDRIAELIFLVVQLLCQTVISNTAQDGDVEAQTSLGLLTHIELN